MIAVVPNAVLGDMRVEINYADYKDFGGVKFPMKIKQMVDAHPALDLTVTDVQPNAAMNIAIPDPVLKAPAPYARVTSQMVAEGVWYVTGGTHHSVLIEMKDHLILVESPLNDDRAVAVLGEVKKLSSKPIKYLIVTHHHFDHSGGVRGVAAEGVTVITHDVSKPFFEKTLAAPATVNPDRLAKSGKKGTVEGTGAKRTLTDGTRTVDIYQIGDNVHHRRNRHDPPAQGEVPDRGRRVHAAGPEHAGADVGEPDLGEPGGQHQAAQPDRRQHPADSRTDGADRRAAQGHRPLRHS